MERMTENKIILVKRKTRLQELIARYNTIEQARFYIEHLGSDFDDYVAEDQKYRFVLRMAENSLSQLGRTQVLDREYVPNFMFGTDDLIVAVGQDGLVANTLKYLNNQLLIGVNPDPQRWDGILLPFSVSDLKSIIQDVFQGIRPIKEVTMAKALLNDGQALYAVNDLFIGQKTHVSARYSIELGESKENQSSSGIIVSTGLGATGWLKSVIAGAVNVAKGIGGNAPNQNFPKNPEWNSDSLYFSVREPFPSRATGTEITFGQITNKKQLKVKSQMPENGVIFSDGIESDFLRFSAGMEALITVAEKKGHLVI